MYRILVVVAARPNMMKMAPILAEMKRRPEIEPMLVHTGQHYDYSMSQVFFEQLELPEPAINLEVGGGTHHDQTGEVMKRFGQYVREVRPDCIIVAGDVNATVACGLVAAKEHIPLVHVESGLRSGDRRMPEEINRIVTDSISDLLLVTEQSGLDNLRREGIPDQKVVLTGNVMIDSLTRMLPAARQSDVLDRIGLCGRRYALLTLHRPSNVDHSSHFRATMDAIADIATELPIIFPVHPRTAGQLRDAGFDCFTVLEENGHIGECGLWTTPPAPYKDFVALMDSAAVVITDSGGIQEETTALGVPCITYRENTERPITAEIGTNRVIGINPEVLVATARRVLTEPRRAHQAPPMWDGKAAPRIVDATLAMLNGRRASSKQVAVESHK